MPSSDPSSPARRSSFAFGSCMPLTTPSALRQLQHPPPHSSLGLFPDHPFSAFSLFQDGITGQEVDGPSHLPSRYVFGVGSITTPGPQRGRPRPPMDNGGAHLLMQFFHQAGAESRHSHRHNPSCLYQHLPSLSMLWTGPCVLLPPHFLHPHNITASNHPSDISPNPLPRAVLISTPTAAPLLLFPLHQDLSSLSSPLETSPIPTAPHAVSLGTSPSLPSSTDPHQDVCRRSWRRSWDLRVARPIAGKAEERIGKNNWSYGKAWMVMSTKRKGWERIIFIFLVHKSSSCLGTSVLN